MIWYAVRFASPTCRVCHVRPSFLAVRRTIRSSLAAVAEQGARCPAGRRPQGHQRHRPRHPFGSDVARCAGLLRPAQNALQSLRAVEQGRRVRPHFRRSGCGERGDRDGVDRRDPPEGAPHRGQPAQKGALSRCIGRTRGGLNSKLHAVCDTDGKPLILLLTEGQVSDYRGAATVLPIMLDAEPRSATRAMTATASAAPSPDAASHPASPAAPAARNPSPTTLNSTSSGTSSNACSEGSRTGAASPPATTDARTPSSAPSASPQPSFSGYES